MDESNVNSEDLDESQAPRFFVGSTDANLERQEPTAGFIVNLKKSWYMLDIFLFISLLSVVLLNSLIWYLCGLLTPELSIGVPWIIFPAIVVWIVLVFVRAFIYWPKHVTNRSHLRKLWIGGFVLFAACLVLWQPISLAKLYQRTFSEFYQSTDK